MVVVSQFSRPACRALPGFAIGAAPDKPGGYINSANKHPSVSHLHAFRNASKSANSWRDS